MSGNTQIGCLLAGRFAPFDGTPHSEGRVVFWHDEAGEFSEEVDSIVGPEAENEALRDVELVRFESNPFALKYSPSCNAASRSLMMTIWFKPCSNDCMRKTMPRPSKRR